MNKLNIEIIKLCVCAISTIQELKYSANDTSEYEIISRLEAMINKLSKPEFALEPLPIESAPKDGTVIDVFTRHCYGNSRITDAYFSNNYDCFVFNRSDGEIPISSKIIGWLPIPQVKGE